MFRYRNGRFYADIKPKEGGQPVNAISFAIPEGCWLDTAPLAASQNLLPMRTPDKGLSISLWLEKESIGEAREGLLESAPDGSIEKITVNGLDGFAAAYEGINDSYYEAVLDISGCGLSSSGDGDAVNLVRVAVSGPKGIDIRKTAQCGPVQEVFSGIRLE